ncbi:hypothetical protein A2Z00_04490 [Candidatus Gottesmanbacteria bacterium RBG_13_45_10]|uniref:Uncharacterized protein n=1 Tax=Candidatus Gottesmanbacteria bacterium RBG_13_45_10 TaxID=1798370 RepID=A0A1F5ZIM8_9BACT|nr:MAG: hypothetical protein A2Z00_04490 [Candidatus Gottesmanbacteria bacterium RBG_13_45_10]
MEEFFVGVPVPGGVLETALVDLPILPEETVLPMAAIHTVLGILGMALTRTILILLLHDVPQGILEIACFRGFPPAKQLDLPWLRFKAPARTPPSM